MPSDDFSRDTEDDSPITTKLEKYLSRRRPAPTSEQGTGGYYLGVCIQPKDGTVNDKFVLDYLSVRGITFKKDEKGYHGILNCGDIDDLGYGEPKVRIESIDFEFVQEEPEEPKTEGDIRLESQDT